MLAPAEIGPLIRELPNFSCMVEQVVTLYMLTCTRGSRILEMEAHEITCEGETLRWTIQRRRQGMSCTMTQLIYACHWSVVPRQSCRLGLSSSNQAIFSPGETEQTRRAEDRQCDRVDATVICSDQGKLRKKALVNYHWLVHDLRPIGRTQLAALSCPNEIADAVL